MEPYQVKHLDAENMCYAFCRELKDVIFLLNDGTVDGKYHLSDWELKFVRSLGTFGYRKGYLTYKQMRVLGGISKTHIQHGEYVHHDWWDGTIQAIRFHEEDKDIFDKVVLVRGTEHHDGIYTVDDEAAAVLAGDTIDREVAELLSASEFRRRFDAKLAERKEENDS